ncbi:glycine-rich domain-containing protein [Enterobacter mori]|nr:hypothetical protein [Enterobacter mori]MCU3985481.1 hypothetical protein [Enterobacter mori]
MANLPETPQWEDGIYQIEVSDPVLGGPDGISNRQGKQLASRTLYLKQQVEKGGSDLAKHVAAADPHTQYAPKASPTFTGTPTAPTQAKTDNSTKLATTAHVKSVVADYAPLSSPALTGKPTAPTAAQTANDTQLANTAFVKAAIAALVASSPEALDTLNELAAALGNDPNFATTMTNALAGKQPLDNTLTALSGKSVAALLEYLGSGDGTLNGRLLNIRVLTSSGNYTPTLGTKKIKVTVIGGGGGSGGVPATTSVQYAASGGGAAGSSVVSLIDVSTLTFPLSYTIGAGGAPGAGAPVTTNGGPGGTTTFGPLTAPGGNGSVYGTLVNQGNTGISGNATPGAIGTGGNILNMRGSAGGYAFLFSANTISGSGGDSLLGKGGFGVGFPPVRSLGTGYGSGGSGVAINLSSAAIAGTVGTAGVIIVEEYA